MAPALMEELVEEILLRFPPDDPARLVHAALVCKPWLRIISGPCFRRKFRELHRTPPMLGFIEGGLNAAQFVPTSSFRPRCAGPRGWSALDARHGRVLLVNSRTAMDGLGSYLPLRFMVWDPIMNEQREPPSLTRMQGHPCILWMAAVLCGAACGPCNHLDCSRGPFLVVFVGSNLGKTFVCTYSSDAGMWSEPTSTQHHVDTSLDPFSPSVLVGNAIYFKLLISHGALKYDLQSREMSIIGLPYTERWHAVLITAEDGGLRCATVCKSKLNIWSRKEVDAGWTWHRAIELAMLLPDNVILTFPVVAGFADDVGVVLLRAKDGLYTFDLKIHKAKKVCKGPIFDTILPYMSFHTPAALGAASTGKGQRADA